MQKLIVKVSVLAVLALMVVLAVFAWFAFQPLVLKAEQVDFTVERGATMRAAARVIRKAGVEVQPEMLAVLARLTGKANRIKAGSYEVERGITAWALLLKLTAGDVSQRELRIIEGWTFRQLRAELDAHPDLAHDTAGLGDTEVLKRIGATEQHPEGLFFPDTYLFDRHASDLTVLRRAYHEMQRLLAQAWEGRVADLPLRTPYEALILASIVEKETGREEDRQLVASVFINRLRIGMRLQTDPTVIYGLGADFDGNLRRKDLTTDTPYNTYTRAGLPPAPIAMPGLPSIKSALSPAETPFLYFVARGDGSSQFSQALDEHNQAVNKFQKGGR